MEPQLGSSPEAHNLAKATFVYLVLIIAYWSKLTLKKKISMLSAIFLKRIRH